MIDIDRETLRRITDVPEHQPEETARTLPIHCPSCGSPIKIALGLCGERLLDAIVLQASRIGAELHCHRCSTTFIYHRVETLKTGNQTARQR